MDGQNFDNSQFTGDAQQQPEQNNFYQDNTTTPYTQSYAYDAQPAPQKTPGLAIAGLVLGILSILLACCYGFGAFLGIPGIICAALSKKKGKSGIGTAGLICSIIGTIFSVIAIIYYVAVIGTLLSDPEFMNAIQGQYY